MPERPKERTDLYAMFTHAFPFTQTWTMFLLITTEKCYGLFPILPLDIEMISMTAEGFFLFQAHIQFNLFSVSQNPKSSALEVQNV